MATIFAFVLYFHVHLFHNSLALDYVLLKFLLLMNLG